MLFRSPFSDAELFKSFDENERTFHTRIGKDFTAGTISEGIASNTFLQKSEKKRHLTNGARAHIIVANQKR